MYTPARLPFGVESVMDVFGLAFNDSACRGLFVSHALFQEAPGLPLASFWGMSKIAAN